MSPKQIFFVCLTALASAGVRAHHQMDPEAKQLFQEVRTACQADADKYCPNMSHRDRHDCMRKAKANLSPSCSAAMSNLEAWREQKRAGGEGREPAAGQDNQ